MDFHRITHPDDPLFAPLMALYEASFPIWERRDAAQMHQLLTCPDFHCQAVLDDGFAGLLCWWQVDGAAYVEHLATEPLRRGGGLGARIMQTLQGRGMPILLEIDPPTDELSRRRLGFYQRLGFVTNDYDYHQPTVRQGMEQVPLWLLSWPEVLKAPARWEAQLHRLLAPYAAPALPEEAATPSPEIRA